MVRLLPVFATKILRPTARFNPTMVRLLLLYQHQAHYCDLGFNPTMVRLLPIYLEFEFTIQLCFNPTMVRLLLSVLRNISRKRLVSIPQWCDCCQGKILGFEGKMGQNERGLAVDLRLPEEPKGVDGK